MSATDVTCYLPVAFGDGPTGHYPTREAATDAVSPGALIGVIALTAGGPIRCADPACPTSEEFL